MAFWMKVKGVMSLGVAIRQFDIIWNSNLGGSKINNLTDFKQNRYQLSDLLRSAPNKPFIPKVSGLEDQKYMK